MAEQGEVDYSQLPLAERFAHKAWKVRKESYEDAIKQFELTPDESDPCFRPFIQDPGLWKGAAGDSNVAAQQEGLAALCAFLKYGGTQGAQRSRPHTIQPIYEKGLTQTRPAAKASALEALLLYVETDKPDIVVEDLLPALSHKQPKVTAATLAALTAIVHSFGVKVVDPKVILKILPKVFGHADKNVRAEAQNLTVELYRWLKEAMKVIFWSELKPVQQQDLDKLFEKVKEEPAPKQERLTRAQQAELAVADAAWEAPDQNGEAHVDGEDDEYVEVDAFDLAEPVDVYSKIPSDFHDNLSSSKWKERKDALDALLEVVSAPRIKEGPYDEVVRVLAKCMKDANIAVVTAAANCVEKLSTGLRKSFAKYRATIMAPMMERLKEKKQSVADALGAAMDAVFASTSLSDNLEEIFAFLPNKNPNVKGETIKFLVRCLRNTRDVPGKDEQKRIADAATKLLTESTEAMRSGGAEILGTLMKIIGERAMGPFLDGLDDNRKTKIKEYFDTAQVKAKEKPKAAPPATKPAPAAAGKRMVGGVKKPVAKKTLPSNAPSSEDTAAFQLKPTVKSIAKPGGLTKPGLTAASGLKLGGLKKAAPSATSSPQRRVVSPPAVADDDETPAPSPSKFAMARGGLAARPLSRPAATPASPPRVSAATNGLNIEERAELEELRLEKDRLLGLTDSLRTSNGKLTAEISELQHQNAQLIEDHTRDVLQIKAKETQLVRARGECDVLRAEVDSARKESDRYKREVSRLGRESLGRERDDMMRGRERYDDYSGPRTDGAIHDEGQLHGPPAASHLNGHSRPNSAALQRTGSGTSTGSRPLSTRGTGGYSGTLSPSEEKEHGGHDSLAAAAVRRRISPPLDVSGVGHSPHRPTGSLGRDANVPTGSTAEPAENWKRAAEVTSQLKARIEAMKAKQGLTKSSY